MVVGLFLEKSSQERILLNLAFFTLFFLLVYCLLAKIQIAAYRWEDKMKMSSEIAELSCK